MKKLAIKLLMSSWAILWTAAGAFGAVTNEKTLSNVSWNQSSPWQDYLPKGEKDNASSGCVPTAYAQLMAYHEWPAIIDDTIIGHGGTSNESGTYVYTVDFNTPVYTALDWQTMKNSPMSTRGSFECGRLMTVVGAFSFPIYSVGATASTVSCPHFNPWYGDFVYYNNPLESEEGWATKRDELFAAVKSSIEANLPVCAGFQSSQGPHAIVLEGYRENNGVPEAYCNLGWGGMSDGWSSRNTNPVGKSYAVTGIFAKHAPRKMVQLEPLPATSPMQMSIKWYAPKYWKELAPVGQRITGYQVEIAAANQAATTWKDDFTALKQDYLLHSMCDGESKIENGELHHKEVIKLVNENGENQLWMYNCPDPRYYEWPETWVATDSSRLTFDSLIAYTEHMDGLLQIKVANGPWRTLFDLTEGRTTDGYTDGGWKAHELSLAELSGKPFKLRIYLARRMRGGYLGYVSWKFKNWKLESVRTFAAPTISKVNGVNSSTFSTFSMPGTYEFAVKPVFADGTIGACFRSTATTVNNQSAANSITVTYRGNEPTDGLALNCAHSDPSVLKVSTTASTAALYAISGNTAIYPEEAIKVTQQDANNWKVTLTPTEDFKTYKRYSNGQKLLLTLAAVDQNGTATYKDLSLTFATEYNDPVDPGTGGGGSGSFAQSDFYLGEATDDEWIYTIRANSPERLEWDEMTFKKADGSSCVGASLPTDAKVRIVIEDNTPASNIYYCRAIQFPNSRTVTLGTLSIAKNGGIAPLRFSGIPRKVECTRLNIANSTTLLNSIVKATTLWVGYESKIMIDGGDWNGNFKQLLGVGTVNFLINQPYGGFDAVNHVGFYGYVTGTFTFTPQVEPNPDKIGEEGGEGEGGGSSGETIDSNATDPVDSISRSYGYDMTENYWDARKEAIQKKKKLFVLSGSTSCNWCHETMKYLQGMSDKINAQYICYYAKRQNGSVPMLGGLPQYGTYDPRTIDAFTGTTDANGNFNPEAAWYSHCDNAFDSGRGFSEIKIDQCLAAANGHTIGNFVNFTLEGPKAVFADTPTKLKLVAHFDDGVDMDVDHGVEWKVVSGSATITSEGVVTVKSGEVTIQARNAFYNFNADDNTSKLSLKTIGIDEVKELKIVNESFNLEDDTTVRLRAEAVLKDGSTTTAYPVWTATIKEFTPLTNEIPLFEKTSGAITLDEKENGLVHYRYSAVDKSDYDGINLQDHVYHVTATLGSIRVEKDIPVYGPTRIWPTKWEIVSKQDVAPGSVLRVKVTEMNYTYGGKVHTTIDTTMAQFETGYAQNYTGYYIDGVTAADIPVTTKNTSVEQLPVKVSARKKGGKYAYFDSHKNDNVACKRVTFHPASTYVTSKNGIRLNTGWLNIYFPGRTDYDKLVDEDSDNDGFTNAEEFLLGTDPTDANDRWRFTSSHFDWPNEVYYRVMFMNHQFAGRDYVIEGAKTVDGLWKVLGVANGKLPGLLSEEDVAGADQCRVFRVKVKFSELMDPYDSKEFTIPGFGVWEGVTLKPKEGEKYAAFIVDANDLDYPLTVDFTKIQDFSQPVFSVPTEQVMPGTLERFVPTAALQAEGWKFVRKEQGIWTEFYAIKGIESWNDVAATTDYAHIPGLSSEDAAKLSAAKTNPSDFAKWASDKGAVKLGDKLNLECFIMNAPNASEAPELKIDEEDLAKILAAKGDLEAAANLIKAKYPNAKVEVKDVTEAVCGSSSPNVKLYTLILSL